MSTIKILEDGRVTIPKHIRDTLGLKAGDVAEAKLEENRIIITPNVSNKETCKASAWNALRQVMDSVHEKNRSVSESEVTADVERAVAELRQEEYEKKNPRCS